MASPDLPVVVDFALAGAAIAFLVAPRLVRYFKRLARRSSDAGESTR